MAPPTVDEVKKMTVKDLKTELEKLGYVMSRTCNPTVLAVLEYAQWHNGLRANEDTGLQRGTTVVGATVSACTETRCIGCVWCGNCDNAWDLETRDVGCKRQRNGFTFSIRRSCFSLP